MMTKEEILERSRKEKKDEGTEYMMNRGRRYGVMAWQCLRCLPCLSFWQCLICIRDRIITRFWQSFGHIWVMSPMGCMR